MFSVQYSRNLFGHLPIKWKRMVREMILRQKSEPEGKWPKKHTSPDFTVHTNVSNCLHHSQVWKWKDMNCEKNWICIGHQLCIAMQHCSGSKVLKKWWERDTNKIVEWWSYDLCRGKAMRVVDCGCVLVLSVNQENSPEGPCNKHKEFIKTTERDKRVRIGD